MQSSCECNSPGSPGRTGGSPVPRISPTNQRIFSSTRRSREPEQLSEYYTTGSSVNSADLERLGTRSPRSLDEYGITAPRMPLHSTAIDSFNLPSRHATFGSQIDKNLRWMPSDVELSNAVDPGSRISPRAKGLSAEDLDLGFATSSAFGKSSSTEEAKQTFPKSVFKRSSRRESLLEWFDRTVEKELQKRREGSLNVGENLVNLESPTHVKESVSSGPTNPLIWEASASGVEISARLRKEQDTDLLEAVDRLAKAEAMISFEGAVRAAEEAAAAAPPEFAEEAAAAGAQGFQAELTGVVKHEFSGTKPIEVVGYVGITRPKKAKKSNFSST